MDFYLFFKQINDDDGVSFMHGYVFYDDAFYEICENAFCVPFLYLLYFKLNLVILDLEYLHHFLLKFILVQIMELEYLLLVVQLE